MPLANYFVALLTAVVTFTSLLLILYIFIRERQHAYTDREGVSNDAYEDLSKTTACGVKIGFGSTFALFTALVLIDPLYFTTNATIPATLAGIGLSLFLLSVGIIFQAFRNLTDEEL